MCILFTIVLLSFLSCLLLDKVIFQATSTFCYWTGLFSWLSPSLLLDEVIFLPVSRPAIGRINFTCLSLGLLLDEFIFPALSPGLLLDGVIALVPTIDTPCYQVLWIRCSPIICFFYKHCKNSLFRLDKVWNLVTCWFRLEKPVCYARLNVQFEEIVQFWIG